jgi:hypothetical protein
MKTIMPEPYGILIAVLKKDGQQADTSLFSGLTQEKWEEIFIAAAKQKVSSLFWHRLNQMSLGDVVPIKTAEKFQDRFRLDTMHNLNLCGELQRLMSVLKSEDVPVILLKGIYLANMVYTNLGLREMHDVDVMSRPQDLARISEILTSMGYRPPQIVSPDVTVLVDRHLPHMIKNGHSIFEIHWNITSPMTSYYIDPQELWKRAVPVNIAGAAALALSPEDLLLHLCIHTSYEHQFNFGLRPFCDIAETIFCFGSRLNWEIIKDRSFLLGWQRGVYLSMLLAKELIGADVPADILKRLRPPDMSDAVLEVARTQVFGDKRFAVSVTIPFAKLLESKRLRDKLRIFWQRVFLPRAMISAQYSVPADSLMIYSCYPRRFADILRLHWHLMKKYQQNDALLKNFTERRCRIAEWLAGRG